MRKLNILQIINEPWQSAIESYGIRLSMKLKERGHNVIVVGIANTPPLKKAQEAGLRTETIPDINKFNPVYILKGLIKLIRLIKREEIDIINTHRSEGQILGIIAAGFCKRKTKIIRTRGDARNAKNYFLNKLLYNKLTDKIIFSSKSMRNRHSRDFRVSEEDMPVIYSAVNTKAFTPEINGERIRNEFHISLDAPLIGIIGRLDPIKGHQYFLEAAAPIVKELPEAMFIVYGQEENTKMSELEKLTLDLNIADKVIFAGFRNDIKECIAALNIGVVSSCGSEMICRVTLELMAMGKPVIGTTVGVIPEIIEDGVTGYLVPPKDSEAIARAVVKLLKDNSKLTKMGLSARQAVENMYNEDIFVKETEKVYYEVVDN